MWKDFDETSAAQFVIEAQLHGIGQNAARAGIGDFRDDLFGLEVNVEQAGRAPGQHRAI